MRHEFPEVEKAHQNCKHELLQYLLDSRSPHFVNSSDQETHPSTMSTIGSNTAQAVLHPVSSKFKWTFRRRRRSEEKYVHREPARIVRYSECEM